MAIRWIYSEDQNHRNDQDQQSNILPNDTVDNKMVVEVDGVISMEFPHLFECVGLPQSCHKLEQVFLHLIYASILLGHSRSYPKLG